MKNQNIRKRCTLLVSVLLVAGGIALACFLWVKVEQRKYAMNRQLIEALKKNDAEAALRLVNAGADSNTSYKPLPMPTLETLWYYLFHRKTLPIEYSPTALQIVCGAHIDFDAWPLFKPDSTELIEAMLRHGANASVLDENKTSILMDAGYNQRPNTVARLIQHGADVNARDKDGATPLMCAVNSPLTIRLLIEHGANMNARDNDGMSVFESAIECGVRLDIITLFLQEGVDVNARDKNGVTPLMHASGHPNIVRLLIKNGAEVNVSNHNGDTALRFASEGFIGNLDSVHLLLGHGAIVNHQNKRGQTALYFAVVSSRPTYKDRAFGKQIVKELIAHGANPNLPNKKGVTVLKVAQSKHLMDYVTLMQH